MTRRALPEKISALNDLALDLRWTWSHRSDRLWEALDARTWQATGNPWLILQTISLDRLVEASRDRAFVEELNLAVSERLAYINDPGWYGTSYPKPPLGAAAFFSMEFGLGESLPLYAGGLGILSGDFLKAASDLAIPVFGVGLLYSQGYFRQIIDHSGAQLEAYPYNDPTTMPVFPVLDEGGGLLTVSIELPGRALMVRVWHARVGKTRLLLLDTNHPLNSPADRGITSRLYDESRERRLLSEITLGVGGWRALSAMGIEPEVLHINEGHAVFAALERTRALMLATGLAFEEARWATRAGTVFTTHTPVASAFDVFEPALMIKYFRDYADTLGLTIGEFLALGRANPSGSSEPFNLSFLAGRMSGSVNGVSRLHGEVCRRLARPLFPRWPEDEIPISHVTNGVHTPSWDSEQADTLWTRTCGKGRWMGSLEGLSESIAAASDSEIWSMRATGRKALVDYVRARLSRDLGQRGGDPEAIERARWMFDPNALTLGFARRFTRYKRPTLLLTDPLRLRKILCDPSRRVQLVVAGKAHPSDLEGKEMVRAFLKFIEEYDARDHVVFLEDYDIVTAQNLTMGVDVWINTPLRPWEACGTSGMKVLVNGGLNLSTLDGWWAEGYSPDVGWALGDGDEENSLEHDERDADELYEILEHSVIPEFYGRDMEGIPRAWVSRVRRSMSTLTPRFSANRMMREYLERAYVPAAAGFERLKANNGAGARLLNAWRVEIANGWDKLHFGDLHVERAELTHRFRTELYLGELAPDVVRVELYTEHREGAGAQIVMDRGEPIPGATNGWFYTAAAPADRPAAHYSPRVIPYHPEARVPLEDPHILWQR